MIIPENPEVCQRLAEALQKTHRPIPVDLMTRLMGEGRTPKGDKQNG